jgi:hypothetical protein
VTLFYVVIGAAAGAGVVWLVGQLAHQPRNPRLAALVGLMAFWLASWPFGVAANDHTPWLGLDSLGARTVEHVLRLVATYCLLVFITSTIGARREVTRSARRQLVPLAVVTAAMVANAAAIPTGLRNDVADLANGTAGQPGPVGVAGVALFFLIENLYYGYAFAVAAWWSATRRCLPIHPALRRGLLTIQIGSVTLTAATAALSAAAVIRWSGHYPPSWLSAAGLAVLALGLVLVVVGLAIPSAHTLTKSLLLLAHRRRVYHELEPLWARLHEAFPDDAFPDDAPPANPGSQGRLRSRLRLPGATTITRRYYRRVIECRDGLTQLSPYLDPETDGESGLPSAEALERAFEARRNGTPAPDNIARTIGPTSGATVDEEAEVLVTLASRLSAPQTSVPPAGARSARISAGGPYGNR